MEEKVLVIIILLIIVIALSNKYFNSYFLKLFLHTALYLFEIILVTFIFNEVFIKYALITPPSNYFEALRNYMFYFSVYQLLLIVTFKLFDSAKIDTLNAIKKFVDQSQVLAEFKEKVPENQIDKFRYMLNSKQVTMDRKLRAYGDNILNLILMYNNQKIAIDKFRCALKLESLEIDLMVKEFGYSWINSILLRIFK